MDIKKEYKFALPTAFGLLFGVMSGSLVFFVILGTVFGLVWGYSDIMLNAKPKNKHHSSHKSSKHRRSRK